MGGGGGGGTGVGCAGAVCSWATDVARNGTGAVAGERGVDECGGVAHGDVSADEPPSCGDAQHSEGGGLIDAGELKPGVHVPPSPDTLLGADAQADAEPWSGWKASLQQQPYDGPAVAPAAPRLAASASGLGAAGDFFFTGAGAPPVGTRLR
jgi:hypothetical protein